MKKETLGFKIEERDGVKVVVEDQGEVRLATDHEVALWSIVEDQERTVTILRKIIIDRGEQEKINHDRWIEETKILLDKLEAAQAQK